MKHIFKRLVQAIPMLFIISILSFLLMHLAPGDPASAYITPKMNVAQIARVREMLGLNEPIYVQYIKWLGQVLKGDLGFSMNDFRPVADVIIEKIPATLGLMGISMLLSLIISFPLGLYTGYKQNKPIDRAITLISYIGISIPVFWFAIMMMYVFAYKLQWVPIAGMNSLGKEGTFWDTVWHGILPCVVLSIYNIAVYTRYIRSSTISQINEPYILTEEAYGFSKFKILTKYVLKNVLLPIITILGMSLPNLIGGAFITETIFAWPGMGRLGVGAIFAYDYPLIMATTMLTAMLLIVGNLIADVLYAVVDPRIRSGR